MNRRGAIAGISFCLIAASLVVALILGRNLPSPEAEEVPQEAQAATPLDVSPEKTVEMVPAPLPSDPTVAPSESDGAIELGLIDLADGPMAASSEQA